LLDLLAPVAPDWIPALELILRDAGATRGWGYLESADTLAGEIVVEPAGDVGLPRGAGGESTLTLGRGPVRLVLQQPPAGGARWGYRLEGLEELIRLGSARLKQGQGIKLPAAPD
jgi:hypothetical protein